MAKKAKAPGTNLPVPQSDAEAEAAVARVGALTREIARVEAAANDRIGEISKQLGQDAAPLRQQLNAEIEGLKVYCEAHRSRLTDGFKSKTAKFATGVVAWRARPAAVKLRDKVEDILARLRMLGFARFIRTKEEVDKEAMLREKDIAGSIAGVVIASAGEDFFVEPLETEVTEAAS